MAGRCRLDLWMLVGTDLTWNLKVKTSEKFKSALTWNKCENLKLITYQWVPKMRCKCQSYAVRAPSSWPRSSPSCRAGPAFECPQLSSRTQRPRHRCRYREQPPPHQRTEFHDCHERKLQVEKKVENGLKLKCQSVGSINLAMIRGNWIIRSTSTATQVHRRKVENYAKKRVESDGWADNWQGCVGGRMFCHPL